MGGEQKGTLGERESQSPSSQKGLNIDFQRGAGHGKLKFGDNIRMKDPKLPDALTPGKDLGTSPREESRACKTERERDQRFSRHECQQTLAIKGSLVYFKDNSSLNHWL